MLRIIHNQTVTGGLLVDDIDDGMPNKMTHRLGSTADPKAYVRDGYANDNKQPCYVPRAKPTDATVAGYIDLNQTPRVLLSAGKGKIKKLQTAGLVTVVSFIASDLNTPAITSAIKGGGNDLTITGTKFLSLAPNISKVVITGTGAVTLTMTQILAAGGTAVFTDTSIVIPTALCPGIAVTTTSAKVVADDKTSNVQVVA
jgi:hypothetical protein